MEILNCNLSLTLLVVLCQPPSTNNSPTLFSHSSNQHNQIPPSLSAIISLISKNSFSATDPKAIRQPTTQQPQSFFVDFLEIGKEVSCKNYGYVVKMTEILLSPKNSSFCNPSYCSLQMKTTPKNQSQEASVENLWEFAGFNYTNLCLMHVLASKRKSCVRLREDF
jgi:hypothetical protein